MADKLKTGIPVKVTFVNGETPPASKLNAVTAQLQSCSARLEQAIGDIWGESYPYSTTTDSQLSLSYGRSVSGANTRSLDIVNLGRLIGPASNLNPHIIGVSIIREDVPTGVYEFCLEWKPNDPTSIIFSDGTVFATLVGDGNSLADPGDYYVDSYGRVFTVSVTVGGTAEYEIDAGDMKGATSYRGAAFNVIPDPNQLQLGVGCSIGALDVNNRRTITLPVVTYLPYNSTGTSAEALLPDPLDGVQLTLPTILVDNWTVDEVIPSGFLYVKNYTKNRAYLGATYYYSSSTAISMGGYDITDDVNDGDKFCIVTVGTDITTSIDDLRKKLRHSHNREYGESLVPVDSLDGVLAVKGNSGPWIPSEIPSNYFPQYLHRDGYRTGVDDGLNDSNIMRGDLGIGRADSDDGDHGLNDGTGSRSIVFFGASSNTQKPTIRLNEDVELELDAKTNGLVAGNIRTKSPVITEAGVRGGDISLINDHSIKSLAVSFTNQDTGTGGGAGTLNLDLGSKGMDATFIPYSFNLLISDTGQNDWWGQYSFTATSREYAYMFYSGASPGVLIELMGTDWGEFVDVRIVIWYTKS